MDRDDKQEKLNKLARDVLLLSRNTLLVNLRFLDMALSRIRLQQAEGFTMMTDGEILAYDPEYILQQYKEEKELPVRDYLHVVFHCVFRHMFIPSLMNEDYWDLACDIAVETAINELDLKSTDVKRSHRQDMYINELRKEVKFITAEKLYRYFLDNPPSDTKIAAMKKLFTADDHAVWHVPPKVRIKIMWTGQQQDETGTGEDKTGGDGSDGEETQTSDSAFANATAEKLEQEWKDISEHMQQDLETFSRKQGLEKGSMMQNLQAVNREKYDYSSFLKKFAVMGEAMKINDDEFDYIFYTYGLQKYKKMPLIEPLEYKEVRRIKEFVIAIDTSGSVQGEIVQKFVQKTYNVLKSTESFFSKINLHIIQCDAGIQEEVKITSQDEFDSYLKNMEIKGLGGTDFRPVFERVNEMVAQKEFSNLKGLIYFTDGYGTFPEKKPGYETAFVFIDDEYNNPDVPPWAIRLVLQSEEV